MPTYKAHARPRLPPPETPGFQDIVREYDEAYWYPNHAPGADTLTHLYFHLVPGLTKALPNHDPQEPRFAMIWRDAVPSRLLEYAARIINQLDGHTMIYVCRNNLDVVGEIHWGRKLQYSFPISLVPDLGKDHSCRHDIEILLGRLDSLGVACERFDSGEEFHSECRWSKSLIGNAATMMQFAYHIMPLGSRKPNPKERYAQVKTLESYLLPLRMGVDANRERQEELLKQRRGKRKKR